MNASVTTILASQAIWGIIEAIEKMNKIYKASNTYDSYPCRYVPIIIDLSASESHQVVKGPSQGGTGTGISL